MVWWYCAVAHLRGNIAVHSAHTKENDIEIDKANEVFLQMERSLAWYCSLIM